MSRPIFSLAYALAMAATVVVVDLAFFRHHFRGRLIANIAVVLLFALVYLGLGGRPWSPRK